MSSKGSPNQKRKLDDNENDEFIGPLPVPEAPIKKKKSKSDLSLFCNYWVIYQYKNMLVLCVYLIGKVDLFMFF